MRDQGKEAVDCCILYLLISGVALCGILHVCVRLVFVFVVVVVGICGS